MISRPSANGKQNPSGTVPPAAAQLHPAVGGEGHPLCLQQRRGQMPGWWSRRHAPPGGRARRACGRPAWRSPPPGRPWDCPASGRAARRRRTSPPGCAGPAHRPAHKNSCQCLLRIPITEARRPPLGRPPCRIFPLSSPAGVDLALLGQQQGRRHIEPQPCGAREAQRHPDEAHQVGVHIKVLGHAAAHASQSAVIQPVQLFCLVHLKILPR